MSETTLHQPFYLNRWLIWKEVIQLLPLVATLLFVITLIVGFQYWDNEQRTPDFYRAIELSLLAVPGIFATGVGALMVGQEREKGSLDWLRSLPIAPRQLILTKLMVATAGLLLMWLIASLMTALLVGSEINSSRWYLSDSNQTVRSVRPISFPLWAIHSLFILLAGFYAAWRIKSQFLSLMALLVLACLPFLVSTLSSEFGMLRGRVWIGTEFHVWLGLSLAFIPIMYIAGYRRGMKVLLPTEAETIRQPLAASAIDSTDQPLTFHSGFAALVWQSLNTSKWFVGIMIAGVLALFFTGFSSGRFIPTQVFQPSWLAPIPFALAIATSLLGVSVFKFSGSSDQLRYLADRGISPTIIYFARHAVPLAIVAFSIIVYTLVATSLLSRSVDQRHVGYFPSLLQVTITAAVIYSVSQWVSQLIRPTTVAVCIAPLAALAAVPRLRFLGSQDALVLALFLTAIIPMLATWWMMQRYMENRDSIRKVIMALVVLASFGVLEIGSRLWYEQDLFAVVEMNEYVQYATAQTEAKRTEHDLILKRRSESKTVSIESELFNEMPFTDLDEAKMAAGIRLLEKDRILPSDILMNLDQLAADPTAAAMISPHAWQGFFVWAIRMQIEFENSADKKSFDQFSVWIDTTSQLVESLRRSHRWLDQEVADRFEIWLINLLTSDSMAQFRQEQVIVEAIARLPNRAERNEARRNAIMASWTVWLDGSGREDKQLILGGIELLDSAKTESFVGVSFAMQFRVRSIAIAGLKAVSESELGRPDAMPSEKLSWWQRVMHDSTVPNLVPAEVGPYSPGYRGHQALGLIWPSVGYTRVIHRIYPAQFYGMQWEETVERIKE